MTGRDAISEDDESAPSHTPASESAISVDQPMAVAVEPVVDQDLVAQVAQLRAAFDQLELQKAADDARYSAEISELRGKVVVQERIRLADALRYRDDLRASDEAQRVRQEREAAASSALRHAHGHCTSCHSASLGIMLRDDAIPASHCVV